ncbi:MAG TPA: class I SAM-dependent methyltransferase [Hyphomonas sp.]|nr:SAM-dependent methyltransferase [Hyphomonas sp.]HRJ00014.1 class I SAM-dependent methyltransferase [Hyphomonas sp.]HRK66496.1 class I SAM-dependent methyltransferase [Hyphomonas sp.]
MDNSAQNDYWNGPAGQKWVRDAERLDAMLRPFAIAVVDAVRPEAGETAIDIGCGAGALSLMLARAGAQVTGVDISAPLVQLARQRADAEGLGAQFQVADASLWRPAELAQIAVSRFGVMFFAQPAKAFHNIRAGMAPGGRLVFACWQPLAVNEWALLPIATAMPFLKEAPAPPPPGAPGPFAFGDNAVVESVLSESGWSGVRVSPWEGLMELPGASAEETADFMMEIGPLARAMADQGIDAAPVKAALVARVRELAGETGSTRLKAAAWIVEARA